MILFSLLVFQWICITIMWIPPHTVNTKNYIHSRFFSLQLLPFHAMHFMYVFLTGMILYKHPELNTFSFTDYVGCSLCILGCFLRFVCFLTLGRLFTFDLAIRKNHQLITSGPYSYIRHPSYTAMIVALAGFYIFILDPKRFQWYSYEAFHFLHLDFLHEPTLVYSLAALGHFMILLGVLGWVLHRLPFEEAMLAQEFKRNWMRYAQKTKRLVPFVY